MAFAQKTWKDRVAEYINRRILTKEDGTTELVSVERSEGTISQEGDAFSAENMNDLEQRIANEFSEQNKNLSKNLTCPDYSAITDITVLPSKPTINSTETFTCPDNGYISIYAYNAIQAGTMHLIINNFEVLLISGNVPNATSNIFIPVSKNDIVRLKTDMQTENWTIEQCRFIKMK